MKLEDIFAILVVHWIADFVLQTHWQATNKSKNIKALLSHTVVYSSVIMVVLGSWILRDIKVGQETAENVTNPMLILLLTTFVCHTVTDYFTSKWTAKLYVKGDYHNFFVVIGLDQVLHYTQLFFTFYWLT